MVGEDLKCLGMFCHQTSSYVADALADLLGGHDPQIAIRELLHEHRGARSVAAGLEPARGIEMTLLLPTQRTLTTFIRSVCTVIVGLPLSSAKPRYYTAAIRGTSSVHHDHLSHSKS